MKNKNKILVSFLREYNLWNKTGFKNIGGNIKVPTYDYYNQITNSVDGEYIKNININFEENVRRILPISLNYVDGNYEEYIKIMLSRMFLIDDEYVYDFRNSISKLYTYGLGYNEPDITANYMNEPDPERVQIVSPTPLLVRHVDNDEIKDLKLIASPYGAYKLNLNPNNPIKALSPSKDYFKNCIDSLSGIGDTSSRFYFTTTKKLGSVDKKDTDTKTDSYFLTRIEKIYLSYVTEDEDGFLIKDADTDTIIRRLNWKGEVLPDEVLEIKEFVYYNNMLVQGREIEGQVYIITVSKNDEKLTIREMKALPSALGEMRQKLHDYRIKYEERLFEDVIENSKTNNMVGKFIHQQPFCNMGEGAIITLTEENKDIVTSVGRTYSFDMCCVRIKEYINTHEYIRVNSKIYKINSKNNFKNGTLDNLFNNKEGNEGEYEAVLAKFTPSSNSVYYVTIEDFNHEQGMLLNIYLKDNERLSLRVIEEDRDIDEFLLEKKKVLDLIVNIDMNNIDTSKGYFGSCDSVAFFTDINYKMLTDGTFESNIIPISSDIPGAKFYNDNVFNTVIINF